MNDYNCRYIVKILQTGFALGMSHRYECYFAYQDMIYQCAPYEEGSAIVLEMWNIILEFEKGMASSPEEEEELKNYTIDQLLNDIEKWYETKKAR